MKLIEATGVPLEQLVKRRVVFKGDEDHRQCWHAKAELRSGVVRKIVPTLAQKAELLTGGGVELPGMFSQNEDVPRVWVQADPSPKYPRGCELAVEPACLLVSEDEPHDRHSR
jgi:hypothetical protein